MHRVVVIFAAAIVFIGALLASPGVEAQTTSENNVTEEATGMNPDGPSASLREVERPGRSGLPLPRFVSLRATKVNLRTGPGVRYPIEWVYQRRGLPVEIVDEFESWRQIRDSEGVMGWVHQSMLSGRRSLLVTAEADVLRREPDADAAGVAQVEPGVIAKLERCDSTWCRVKVETFTGYLSRDSVYGLLPGEEPR